MKRDTKQDTDLTGRQVGQRQRGGAGSVADRADRARVDLEADAQAGGEGGRANTTPLSLTMHKDVGICGSSGLSMVERLEQGKRMMGLPVQDIEKKAAAAGVTTPQVDELSPRGVTTPIDGEGVSAGVTTPDSKPEKKAAPEAKKTGRMMIGPRHVVLAMARAMRVRPAVVIKAAESNLAWRDERGVLIICDEHLPMMAKALEMKLRVLQDASRAAVPDKLAAGEEYVKVESIPANNRLLGCVRLASGHYGEHVNVRVNDALNYKMGDEFIARSSRNGMEAVYGNH